MYKIRYKIIIILLFFLSFYAFCEQKTTLSSITNIDDMDRSWFSALTGSPSSMPIKSDDGFYIIQEEKFLAYYSNNGKNLWQTNLNSKIVFYSIFDTNFIAIINSKNQLILLNPSGLILWKIQLDFTPIASPIQGFDGRIFVQGKNCISCFGIASTKKWQLKTENCINKSATTFNDGSLLCILEKTIDGKSVGIRISPFSQILEEIVFQGKVINSFETEDGIILVFSNGQIGMCSIDNNKNHLAYSKWINKDVGCTENTRILKIRSSTYAIFTPSKSLNIINSKNGICQTTFNIPEIISDVLNFDYVDNKFFISNSTKLVAYYPNGKFYKQFNLPNKTGKYNWNYSTFLDTGYFIFLAQDWTINAFRIISSSTTPTKNNYFIQSGKYRYKNFIEQIEYQPNPSYFSDDLILKLKNGNYATKEKEYLEQMICATDFYLEQKKSISINYDMSNILKMEYSIFDIEKILNIIPLFESQIFSEKLAELLLIQDDKTLILKTLSSICQCGYDPSGAMILEIERLIKKTSPSEKKIIEKSLDAVYEICRFMGRPAFFSSGKKIVMNLFYPQYDESTKKYARVILQKLADLQM